jgi:hypothetical protein
VIAIKSKVEHVMKQVIAIKSKLEHVVKQLTEIKIRPEHVVKQLTPYYFYLARRSSLLISDGAGCRD